MSSPSGLNVEDPAQILSEKLPDPSPQESPHAVPGQPSISFADHSLVQRFLWRELSTDRLKRLYHILFLAGNPTNISPLHHQKVKQREILITERPDLHLVWWYERIFIKPVPKCLLSRRFWECHIDTQTAAEDIASEARGFMRTYTKLVSHETDLEMAKSLRLIPEHITWEAWCDLSQQFQTLRAPQVAPRYHYGELRLTRLNFWSTLVDGCSYLEMSHNYATYFSRFAPPYLFIFGALTVVLTALQTGLSTRDVNGYYNDLAERVVPFTLILTIIGLLFMPLVLAMLYLKEWYLFTRYHQELA